MVAGGFDPVRASLAVILGPVVWRVRSSAAQATEETRSVRTTRYAVGTVVLAGACCCCTAGCPTTTLALRGGAAGRGARPCAVADRGQPVLALPRHRADYAAFYGSLGGVAITLLFFYISAVLFIFGAEFNAVWRERSGRAPAPQGNGGGGDGRSNLAAPVRVIGRATMITAVAPGRGRMPTRRYADR